MNLKYFTTSFVERGETDKKIFVSSKFRFNLY